MTLIIWAGTIIALLVSIAPLSPKSFFITDTLSHFVLQAAVMALLLMALAIIYRIHGRALYIGLLLSYFLCIIHLWPYINVHKVRKPTNTTLKVLQANVLVNNYNPSKLQSLIKKESPDLIIVAEVNSKFAEMFESIKTEYPNQKVIVQDKNSYGMAVLSKIPLNNIQEKHLASPAIPSLFFNIGNISFASIHTANPLKNFVIRDLEMEAIATWYAEEKPKHLIIAGDLNATPYCTALKKMTRKTGTTNARKGFGIYGTYSSDLPTRLSRIPIDHILASKDLKVMEFRTAAHIDSDHIPTITVIELPKSSQF